MHGDRRSSTLAASVALCSDASARPAASARRSVVRTRYTVDHLCSRSELAMLTPHANRAA